MSCAGIIGGIGDYCVPWLAGVFAVLELSGSMNCIHGPLVSEPFELID